MENDLEEEPESIASLMGIEASPPSADSPREGRFSVLRITGLCLALMVLSLVLWLDGSIYGVSITFGSAIAILLAGIAIPLVLLVHDSKRPFWALFHRCSPLVLRNPFQILSMQMFPSG